MRIDRLITERKKYFDPSHGAYIASVNADGSVTVTHHKEPTIHLNDESELAEFSKQKRIPGSGHIGIIIVRPKGKYPIEK